MVKSWETLRGVQDALEDELKGGAVEEEDLSELLKLQEKVKKKIHQSESILDWTGSFHLTSTRLEALLQSLTGSCGSSEDRQQVQSLFKTALTLKSDICAAVDLPSRTCFSVQQLEARLVSLDALCVSWLNEAARREEKLRRERLSRLLSDDISQLRDSFKELKKRFSNLRFNYLKRNDKTRNMKAARNQLQQVELYEEKLQALRKRLQAATARLALEVKDGGVAREAEDAVNELQRQMGEFERSVGEHQKTLEMTCRLQQAMEEYQFWCEDASATISRVGKFSSECRSTEAVSVLHRQFEKFVWPTVPQQEERISQITELAVRLHGVEEGRRYIEKTVSKHSEMVESIRELNDGLMQLEAKLKLESLRKQPDDGEKEIKEEKEKKLKENRKTKKKKEQIDNRSTQEASDLYELKETGHTPELTAEHYGKEVPVKRQTAANRKPPLQKSCSQEADRQTESRLTSSYCSSHTFSLSCSPVEANRRVHAIHSLSQRTATEATPSPSVIGPSFSDIQREFQKDASVGGLSEAELQQHDAMTEDSLSNDEYDCASPDDISLPPLAETPESNMVQSDVEEGYCFSSHSIHINQYSRQSEHSGTGTGTGAVRQQRESSQTESCPTPPTSRQSNTRYRSESSSFVQSPLTVPAPTLITSTLCSILKTKKTSTANVPQSADLSQGGPESNFPTGYNTLHKSITPDSCSNKESNVPEKRIPLQSELLLKEHNSQYNQPQRSTGTPGKITQNIASKGETMPQTDPIPQDTELNHTTTSTLHQSSYCPQPFNGQDPDLLKDTTPPQNIRFLKCSTTFPQTRTSICQNKSFPLSFLNSDQAINSSQITKETSPVSKPQNNSLPSTLTQQTIYFQSSPHHTLPQASSSLSSPAGSPLSQSETLPQIEPVPKARAFAQSCSPPVLHKDRTQDTGILKSCASWLQNTTTLIEDGNLSQSYLESRSGLDQDVPSSQTSKETSSVTLPQSSTATTVKQTVYSQSSPPPNSQCTLAQASSNLRSQQESLLSQGSAGLPEVHSYILPEPTSISNISISSSTITSSNRFSSKQNHQTVYSLHESLTSTCTQQCVHDPGMTPGSTAKPAAPPQCEPQSQALAQQANPHVTLLSSSPHLLTPDQDPNICQPMTIREEIRLTPQIQGPSLPAPLPQAQAESLPQGKASKPGPPCFTRPLSRATVMEGSPVTLEVEVTGQPEPTLTWCKDGDVSATDPGRALLSCEDVKHFPEASDSDGVLYEAQAAGHHDCSGDTWLVAEVFDIISVDWQTWFGTLCVLMWLLYLILL
ncbi:flocculation protein FLO11 isoform X2 [Cottoperca gobio]|nr:coiled-coil domain-containing protein 141 isoform X2 [Cottoperca gobio]